MRAVGLHADVITIISRVWQTTCVAVRSGEEGFLIDSPIYPDELEAVPPFLEQVGFPLSGLLATHADWDHLLGRLAFPEASLGCGETTAARLRAEPGAAQRELRGFDAEYYIERPRPLSLGQVQALPAPGYVSLGQQQLELHPADGHTADGTAYWIPWTSVLVCGDYVSPVEIPVLSEGGSASAYLATLTRLEPLIAQAETIVPGHGAPMDREGAKRLLEEDVSYLNSLIERGVEAGLPPARRTPAQKRIHAENAARLGA